MVCDIITDFTYGTEEVYILVYISCMPDLAINIKENHDTTA